VNQDEILALLRDAHAERIDPAHYSAVRARVISEIQRPRVPWWRFAAGFATAAAVMVFAISPPRLQLPPLRPMAAAIPPASLERPRAAVPRVRREPVTIKLQTNYPNIVIYWIAD